MSQQQSIHNQVAQLTVRLFASPLLVELTDRTSIQVLVRLVYETQRSKSVRARFRVCIDALVGDSGGECENKTGTCAVGQGWRGGGG